MRIAYLAVFAVVIGYSALRIWRQRKGSLTKDKSDGFRPRIGFTRMDGMESLSLLIPNGSNTYVWAEEIRIFLSGLIAEQQTAEPSYHETQQIRQMVGPDDMLPISLAQIIYKAAGNPQRKYSCVLSSVLRYRIGEEWFEKNMDAYRIRMIGLKASGIDLERKPVQPPRIQDKTQDIPQIATKLK
jgi:hypothetical protein